jgi:hypothetical protein
MDCDRRSKRILGIYVLKSKRRSLVALQDDKSSMESTSDSGLLFWHFAAGEQKNRVTSLMYHQQKGIKLLND